MSESYYSLNDNCKDSRMKCDLDNKSVSTNDDKYENNEINSNENLIDDLDNQTIVQIINSSNNLKFPKKMYIPHSVKILIPNLKEEQNNVKNASILNNVYKNFKIYENKIEEAEEEKINDEDNTNLTLNNLVKRIDSIKIDNGMSEIYNDILEGVNYFNLYKIRKSYYCIKNIFLKKYNNDKMIKAFMENECVSEILYRYKIIKKMGIIFNIIIEDPEGYPLNYSVLSKKRRKNFISDYMIDLLDINGKTHPQISLIPINEHSDSCSNNTTDENKNDASCNNLNDTKHYENITLLFEQLLCENSKKKEMTNIEEGKYIKNSYIDFNHFQLAYKENNNSIYYFITHNKIYDIVNQAHLFKTDNNNDSNSSITKDENKQGSTNTYMYFYLNLRVPSNFTYVLAAITESNVFRLWFPFYNFPIRLGVSECKLLKCRGYGDKIIYSRVATPWILSDRYIVFDTWICDDLEFSKGIYIYTTSVSDNLENIDLGDDISKCLEVNITMYGMILPKSQDETDVKYYIEICPNMRVTEFIISFLTK
ncbi:hypothetical protein YYE_01905 [Plasmodium vinckei vinckei]|nr:hypothetical protein YYE_01905 [Plasmodium vinckei vinckei]